MLGRAGGAGSVRGFTGPQAARVPAGARAGPTAPPPPRRRRPVYELHSEEIAPAGIGSYLLALLLIVCTTAAILAGGWIGGAQATLMVGVVAVLEAILLGRAGIGRLGAVTLGLPLCAAVVVPTTIGLLPASVSHGGWAPTAGEYLLQAFVGLLATGPGDFVDWAFMVGLESVVWLCGFWLGWVAFRERHGILAVLPSLVILAVNALNAPSINLSSGPGSSVGVAETFALFAGLLVVGMAELSRLAAGWRRRRVAAMEGLRSRFTVSLALAGILVVGVSLVIPPLTHTAFVNLFAGWGGRGVGSSGAGTGPAQIGYSPDVKPGGRLVPSTTSVLSYVSADGAPMYLEANTADTFSNGDWLEGFSEQQGNLLVPAGQTIPLDPSARGGARTSVSVEITLARPATGQNSLALFPGEPISTDHPGVVTGEAVHLTAGGAGSAAATTELVSVDSETLTGGKPSKMGTVGSQSVATVAQLEAAGVDYPPWVTQLYASPLVGSQEPQQARDQAQLIANLAQAWVSGVPDDPYDQATEIEARLRGSEFTYTLNPPAPPQGEWPVVYFLEQSHAGYCQYFADAMGAMLRSLHIPARLVSGYGPGTATAGSGTASGERVFNVTGSDAHVWVEAYFPGYGWIPFEPTPSSNQGVYAPFPRGGSLPAVAVGTNAARPTGKVHTVQSAPPTGAAGSVGAAAASGWWKVTLPAVAVALIVLAVLLLLWWRRPPNLAGAWRRLDLAGHLAGAVRHPSETRPAYAMRLARALGGGGPPLLAPELGVVAAVSSKAEFAAGGLDPEDRALWTSAWQAIARGTVRALRCRILHRPPAV
jgi:hypothetical protein